MERNLDLRPEEAALVCGGGGGPDPADGNTPPPGDPENWLGGQG